MMKTAKAIVLASLFFAAPAWATDLQVAAASSTKDALDELVARFEQETKNHVEVTYGASGKFFTQIQQGAPFDLYFSADHEYPSKLFQQGLSEAPTRYGRGRLVLWAPKGSSLDLKKLETLSSPKVRTISIANPDLAPYGRAAVEVMRASKLYQQLEGKLVKGENISQAAQFADKGGADVAFLSLSLAVSPRLKERGRYRILPASLHHPIDLDAVVLKGNKESKKIAIARQFLRYCTSPQSREVWGRYGLE